MVSLGRPGAGEELLSRFGFDDVQRVEIPFAWEFADPETYARALAASGPAYEAIQSVGEEAFKQYAVNVAREQVRDGLPLRAEIKVVGYLARKPVTRAVSQGANFLPDPEPSPAVEEFYAEDLQELGYVMNGTRLWGRHPESWEALFGLIGTATEVGGLSFRQRAVLVTATAATIRDSYCSMAWGSKFATKAGPETAAGILRGDDSGLDPQERALAAWARRVASDPNATTADDVQELRDAGFIDLQIFAITVFVAARLAFSTVNDALGSTPDRRARSIAPASGPRRSRFRTATARLRLPWSLRTRLGASHRGLMSVRARRAPAARCALSSVVTVCARLFDGAVWARFASRTVARRDRAPRASQAAKPQVSG